MPLPEVASVPTWHQNRSTQIAMPAVTQEKPVIDEKELELQVSYPCAVFINYVSYLKSLLTVMYNLSWWELLSF